MTEKFFTRQKALGRKASGLFRFLALLPRILAVTGGIKGSFAKLLKVLSREGISGALLCMAKAARGSLSLFAYEKWIRQYDTLSVDDRTTMKGRIERFSRQPLISVVMPVYNPNPTWLQEAIDSVRTQIYPHWELCIADDASTEPAIRQVLDRNVQQDKRIKVLFREKNGHISAASNDALSLVSGEFVVLLDHDDVLAEHALYSVVDAINLNADGKIFFSDEDKIDKKGRRYSPHFKCDWNYDLFLSYNFISHLGCYISTLVREIKGFRLGYEGSQDYDLALRCIERVRSDQIIHIPHILYHWRAHEASTASRSDSKPYAMLAGQKAINDHLERKGIKAVSELQTSLSNYRVRYELPDPPPRVSLIMIMAHNDLESVQHCINSILEKTTYPNYEIVIVDAVRDASRTSDRLSSLERAGRIRIFREPRTQNWSGLNNAAVAAVQGEVIGLVANGIEVFTPNWLTEMVSVALQPGVGAVGAKLWSPSNRLYHAGLILGIGGVAGRGHRELRQNDSGYFGRAAVLQSVSAVSGDCLVIQKNRYVQTDGFDDKNLKTGYIDVDFCMRLIELGYRNVWTPYAELRMNGPLDRIHNENLGNTSRTTFDTAYMKKRWGSKLLNDPAYNPNLTLEREDFSLAWPPRTQSLVRN